MEKMTITEGLAEIKLIQKKIEKKVANIKANATRFDHVPDPYAKEGGSQELVKRELQSVADLDARLVAIRGAIALANISTKLAIGEHTKTIYDWITWKREIAEQRISMFRDVITSTRSAVDKEAKNPQAIKDLEGKVALAKLIVNADLSALQHQYEQAGSLMEQVDGKLSLKNATTFIEF